MREIRVSIAIQSHLSDACIEMGFDQEMAYRRIQFAKVLVMQFPDTSVEVSEDRLNELYKKYILKKQFF